MSAPRITVSVGIDGKVEAERLDTGETSGKADIRYGGLDAQLIDHFERWLTLRGRSWREDEIRSFGALLHRCLFPDQVWNFVQREIARRGDEPVRLALRFPTAGFHARLASLPWEYLYRPDSTGYNGFFLAGTRDVVLSRYVPPAPIADALRSTGDGGILAVVARHRDPLLGPVEADDVLDAIEQTAGDLGIPFGAPVIAPTSVELEDVLRERQPQVLHFMGHGSFDTGLREGSIALRGTDGGSDWVAEGRLVGLLQNAEAVPGIVVLHACEGGAASFAERFAGLGASLLRGGVRAVVAMQYEVTNETAIAFSTALYAELRNDQALDHAVQTSRWRISGHQGDPRLRGIPVVYLDGSPVGLVQEEGAV